MVEVDVEAPHAILLLKFTFLYSEFNKKDTFLAII
jgi:hypothetical protein